MAYNSETSTGWNIMNRNPLHILLFEDNPGDARMIQLLLNEDSENQFIVENVKRLSEGIQFLQTRKSDLLLLDLSLPDSQGISTFIELYKHAKSTPILVLTGTEDDATALQAMQEGAQDYLVKGNITSKFLTHCVRYAVERQKLLDALGRQTKELRNRETNFRNLITTNADAMVLVDAKNIIRFANPAAESLFNRPMEMLIGKPFDFPLKADAISEVTIQQSQKDIRVAEMRVSITQWEKETVCLASLRDITERKQAEAELMESQERFNAVAHSTLDLISETTPDGRFIYVSPNHHAILGYKPEKLLEKNIFDILHPEEHSLLTTEINEAVKKNSSYHIVCRFKHKSGKWRHFECVGKPYKTSNGEIRRVSVSRDITERLILEEQLRQSQKMEAIGRLAGGIAHDFNNILTVIIGHSELLLNVLPSTSPLYTSTDEIKKAGDRAISLVRQLLAFSRKQILEPKVININMVIANLEKMLKRLIGEDILLETILSQSINAIKADPGQIEQVLINLAVNARDAMPSGGKLTIETSAVDLTKDSTKLYDLIPSGSYILITIKDTGLGMDQETLSHLFEPFFTTKEQGKGTGLGLSTVYGIIKQSGGYIFADSEPKKGTTFKLYFPEIDGEPEDINIEHFNAIEPSKGEETILIIEDEDGVRSLITEILQRQGYNVLQVPDGSQAIELSKLYPGQIDLILTDVVVPGISGREAIKHIMPMQPNAKILYMSGYSDDAIKHHGVIEPETSFIQKPFTRTMLVQKIIDVLNS